MASRNNNDDDDDGDDEELGAYIQQYVFKSERKRGR
jgi:hypothetical protein